MGKQFDVQWGLTNGYSMDQISSYMKQNNLTPINMPSNNNSSPSGTINPQTSSSPDPQNAARADMLNSVKPKQNNIAESVGSGALNILGNFIPQPIKDVASMGTNIAGSVGDLINYKTGDAHTQQDALKSYAEHKKNIEDTQSKYGFAPTNTQGNQFNPAQFATKSAQGASELGAYAVPFGKGTGIVSKAILPGAVSGALMGAGQENATPQSVIGSSIMGAGAGMAAPILDKATGLLSKGMTAAGDAAVQSVRHIRLPASLYGAAEENAVNATLDKYGFHGTAGNQYEKLQPTMQNISDTIDQKLMNENKPVQINSVIDDYMKNVKGLVRSGEMSSDKAKQEITSYISSLSDELPHQAGAIPSETNTYNLFQLKKQMNGDLKAVFNKLKTGESLTDRQKIMLAGRNTLDDIIANAHPDIKNLTRDQSHLYDAIHSLETARDKSMKLPVVGTMFSTPAQWGVDAGGRTLQNVGKLKTNIGDNAAANKLLSLASSSTASKLNNVPQGTQGAEPNSQNNNPSDQSNSQIDHTTNDTTNTPANQGGFSRDQAVKAIQWDMTHTGGKNVSVIQKMFELANPMSAKGLSGPQQNSRFMAQSGTTSINDIENMINNDPNILTKNAIPGSLGARQYEAAIGNAIDVLSKLRTGKAAQGKEWQTYRDMFPKIGDTTADINYKLAQRKQEFNNYINNQNPEGLSVTSSN